MGTAEAAIVRRSIRRFGIIPMAAGSYSRREASACSRAAEWASGVRADDLRLPSLRYYELIFAVEFREGYPGSFWFRHPGPR